MTPAYMKDFVGLTNCPEVSAYLTNKLDNSKMFDVVALQNNIISSA
jgi:hypothetical protein